MNDKAAISESRFYMWRAVFAMAHADNVITDEERRFMRAVIRDHNFTDFQKDILLNDIDNEQDISSMFSFISDQEDRTKFFYYARLLCWSDGDFDAQEQEILTRLKRCYIENVDFDKLMEDVDLELEEDETHKLKNDRMHFETLQAQNSGKKRRLGNLFGLLDKE